MIDLGGQYPAAIDVTDASGNLVNPSSVSLVITLPDGTTPALTVPNPPSVTGQFRYPYTTVQPGRHVVRWTTTTPNTGYTDVFDVKEAQAPSILSLADAKQQLAIDQAYTGDDDEIRGKLYALTKAIENYVHETIVPVIFTEQQQPGGTAGGWGWSLASRLRLLNVPVISLISVTSFHLLTSWDVTQFYTDVNSGLTWPMTGPPLRGPILVTYKAGYTIVPYNYLEAARTLLQFLWEAREGSAGMNTGVIGIEEATDYKHFTSMPRKVTEWLGPPRPVVM